MLQKTLAANRLFDFYGPLLTENQRSMFRLYYHEDLSYSEVAEMKGCSRQAVHDVVERALERLRSWEERLSLIESFKQRQEKLRQLKICIEDRDLSTATKLVETLLEDELDQPNSSEEEL